LPTAKDHLEEALATFKEINVPIGEATCLVLLSDVARLQGDFDSALQYNTEALEIEHSAGRAVSVASALQHRAWIALDMDRPDIAREAMEELLPFRQQRGEPGETAACLGLFAIAEARLGNPGAARTLLLDALELERSYGKKGSVPITLTMLGEVEVANGHRLEAQGFFEQAEALHREEGNQAAAAASRRQIEDLS
jgi:tetratricopeptide (TPR) repeat protein